MEKELKELVHRLEAAAGANLKSVVLYGSAASGEFNPKHSDLNVLCVLEHLDSQALAVLSPAATWWARKGHPAPLIFSLNELRRASDVFSLEFLDIQAHHRILWGEDAFARLEIPMGLHRVHVERELRTDLLKLRQHYLAAPSDNTKVLGLMTESVSSFASLFRHALLVLTVGTPEQLPHRKRAIIGELAKLLDFDASPFYTVLDIREGKLKPDQIDVPSTFRAYLQGVDRVTNEVDERLNNSGSRIQDSGARSEF
jgi:predicted nucleotidyltransferase